METKIEKPKKVNANELEKQVKEMYKKVALNPEVKYHFEIGRGLAEHLGYQKEKLDAIPYRAIESFAGVGHHFDLAALEEGEVVVDLGSGSGMDAFYAANQVKKSGEVIGIDMTVEQLEKSRKLAAEKNFSNTLFRESYIEELPIVSNAIDVVMSNGVINLSSRKDLVFREAARVLRRGGRLVITDITTERALPENITCNATLWAACIGGAMQTENYLKLIEDAGFEIKKIKTNPYTFISENARNASAKFGIKSISVLAFKI